MLPEADYIFIAREVKARSGGILSAEMNAIVEQRLVPLSRREGFSSVSEMVSAARLRGEGKLWSAIADALVQTETRFFRDRAMFAKLRNEILPELFMRRGGLGVRIWCAGCGSGQEAYSIAMINEELRSEGLGQAYLTATDISERLLDKARTGLYTSFEVQRGLPIRKLIAHFERAQDLWRISDRMRAGVKFTQHNLLHDAAPLGSFDLVICANVLSSFDAETRASTIERIGAVMAPGGILVIGQGEALPETQSFGVANGIHIRGLERQAA